MSDNRALAKNLFPFSLFVAWSFDFLFWEKSVGVSFPIFVATTLIIGFWLARKSGVDAARSSFWLLLPISFFAFIGLWRLEPFSLFLSRALTLFLMAILAANFLGGRWTQYSLSDYLVKFSLLPFNGLSSYRQLGNSEKGENSATPLRKRLAPLGRGLLIASPVVVLLALLLASADPIFEQWLENLLAFLRLENLLEYLWRLFYILILAYLLVGVYAYALIRSQDKQLIGEDKPPIPALMGFTEAATVLVSVELLFSVFVGIQVRYFFGGDANVNLAGFTYAEYARRGFAELAIVALISVGLFVGLSLLSRRERPRERLWFSRLGIALLGFVAVILVSAYQRLLLYESVFGFTRTRTNVHVFMIWTGLLLLVLVILESLGRRRAFTLAGLLVVLGYGISINILNVDAFIVHLNVKKLRLTEEVDIAYLASLSSDALQPLLFEIQNSGIGDDQDYQAQLLAAVTCLAFNQNEFPASEHWQGFNFSKTAASQDWQNFKNSLEFSRLEPPLQYDERGLITLVDGDEYNCSFWGYYD